MEVLIVVAVAAVAVWLIAGPLRSGRAAAGDEALDIRRAELEAARESKYREIRDAELDHRTGKLSEADWRALDRQLRREAVEILKRLDEVDDAA
jgi:hypothetical protein